MPVLVNAVIAQAKAPVQGAGSVTLPPGAQGTGPAPAPESFIACGSFEMGPVKQAYQAAVAVRNELRIQQDNLQSDRGAIATRLREGNAAQGADLGGLEKRITLLDDQIRELDGKIATANGDVARTASVRCAVEPPLQFPTIPPGERDAIVASLFIVVVLLPISIAFARRIWRRGSAAIASLPRELVDRLTRLEQSVESVAIEVERIGEGQRFMTNVLVDSVSERALGAGTMEAIAIKSREAVEQQLRK